MSVPRILIAPSILAADFSRLGDEVRRAERAGADWIHVDVMDGHFVPNITMGPVVVAGVRRATRRLLDVHLMIEHPEVHAEAFARAGADRIIIHIEAMVEPARRIAYRRARGVPVPRGWALPPRGVQVRAMVARARAALRAIRRLGCRAGVSLNPLTPATYVRPLLDDVDLVLPMTVWPGFGGQDFMESVLPKIAALRKMIGRGHVSVDGGLNPRTAAAAAAAGADVLVAGTATFRARDMERAVRALRHAAERGRDIQSAGGSRQ